MHDLDSRTEEVLATISDRVLVISFNRPTRRNAFTPAMLDEVARLLTVAEGVDSIDAVVLTGEGTAFCAGGDMADDDDADEDTVLSRLREQQQAVVGRVYRYAKPVIAALPGAAAGAGVGIALACHLRVGTPTAKLVSGFLGVGLSGDFGTTWFAHHLMGAGRAQSFLLLDQRVSADECLSRGLFHEVAAADDLRARAAEIARTVAHVSLPAYREIRANLADAPSVGLDEAMHVEAQRMLLCGRTDEHRRAIARFSTARG